MPDAAPRFLHYVPDSTKGERYHRVALAVAAILLQRRPDDVTVAAVARRAKVSRPWIYKYFGRDTRDLIAFAVQHFGTAFNALDGPPEGEQTLDAWCTMIAERTHKALDDAAAAPWVLQLYLRYRHAPGPLGEAMRGEEERHLERFLQSVPRVMRARHGKGAVRAFSVGFQASRIGVYFRYSDPATRKLLDRDAAAAEVLRPLQHFVGSSG